MSNNIIIKGNCFHQRVLFNPDIKWGQKGIRIYSKITASFLKCFGKRIEKITVESGKVLYLDGKSFDKWVKRNATYLTGSVSLPSDKIKTICQSIENKDPISNGLNAFNNEEVQGQINGIYITTNETNLGATAQILKDHLRPKTKTIHIGCATWHNLDIMCVRKSDYGLIVDFNPKNKEFIQKTIELIKISPTRDAFKKAMVAYLKSLGKEERKLFFHRDLKSLPTDRIEQELTRVGSFLQSDENYLFIKELVFNNRLHAITENITNCDTFLKIKEYLAKNNVLIDTVYLSNICNFMNTAVHKNAFVKSVRSLLNENTIFISCPKIKQDTILEQTVLLGRDLLADNFDTALLF